MSLRPLRLDRRRHRTVAGDVGRSRSGALIAGTAALVGLVGLVGCESPEADGRDLAVQLHHLPHTMRVGDEVTARGTLTNLGTTDADGVHFRIGSTPNLAISFAGGDLGACTSRADLVDCTFPEGDVLGVGETVEFIAEVRAVGMGDAAFAVLATSPGGEPKPDVALNGAYHVVDVAAPTPSTAAVSGRSGAGLGSLDPTAGVPFDVASTLSVDAGTVEDLVVTQSFPAGTTVHGTYGFAEGWDPEADELVQQAAECVVIGRSVSCRFAGPIASTVAMDRFWVVTGVTAASAGDLAVDLDLVGSDPAGGGPARFTVTDPVPVAAG